MFSGNCVGSTGGTLVTSIPRPQTFHKLFEEEKTLAHKIWTLAVQGPGYRGFEFEGSWISLVGIRLSGHSSKFSINTIDTHNHRYSEYSS